MMTKTSQQTMCSHCDAKLVSEERENPFRVDADTLCDRCYDDYFAENSFFCVLCEQEQPDSEQADHFVLFDSDWDDPGLYEILQRPFYINPLLGNPFLLEHCVRRVGPVPEDAIRGDSEAEFVCKDCMAGKVVKR